MLLLSSSCVALGAILSASSVLAQVTAPRKDAPAKVEAPAKAAPRPDAAKAAKADATKSDASRPDPQALLLAAKAASGGAAWDALRTQHSVVKLGAAGLTGTAERWSDIASGRALLRYSIGPISGALGNDGAVVWTQDGIDEPKVETGANALELAANAAYRDRLAFWFPEPCAGAASLTRSACRPTAAATTSLPSRPRAAAPSSSGSIAESKLIERLVENEGDVTRTEVYSDRREVQGVRIPFKVLTRRGDPKFDETVEIQKLTFNEPLDATSAFGPPEQVQEIGFPAGQRFGGSAVRERSRATSSCRCCSTGAVRSACCSTPAAPTC